MEILKSSKEYNILIDQKIDIGTNVGWYENMAQFEDEIMKEIINPIDNYETVRYIHSPYNGITENVNDKQCDIWYKFYFLNDSDTYVNGLDYNLIGITPNENSKMLKQSTKSFFRLEFFKTPNNEPPNRINRKLAFGKNLNLSSGEKFFYNTLRKEISIPVFMGNNYKNKENMYLFWFQDNTVLSDSSLSGNTLWMTAKFFNAKDGTILDFVNTDVDTEIVEQRDLYYKVQLDNTDYSFQILNYGSNSSERVGKSHQNPIKFFQKR